MYLAHTLVKITPTQTNFAEVGGWFRQKSKKIISQPYSTVNLILFGMMQLLLHEETVALRSVQSNNR